MSDNILDEIKKIFEIKEEIIIEFKEVCGFIFVFKIRIISIKDRMPSAEIKPLGVIYTENDDYYFAPLYEHADIDEILREFVKKEEYFHSQQ